MKERMHRAHTDAKCKPNDRNLKWIKRVYILARESVSLYTTLLQVYREFGSMHTQAKKGGEMENEKFYYFSHDQFSTNSQMCDSKWIKWFAMGERTRERNDCISMFVSYLCMCLVVLETEYYFPIYLILLKNRFVLSFFSSFITKVPFLNRCTKCIKDFHHFFLLWLKCKRSSNVTWNYGMA